MPVTTHAYDNQKRANRSLSILEYSSGKISLESLPRALFIELTQGCNLKCPMCRPELIAHRNHRMSNELFDQIASTLFPTVELVDLRGWGESLILPEMLDRIETVQSYGAKIRIVTNLSFRRDKVLHALVNADAIIEVSLDTADPSLLESVRTGSRLELIAYNIRQIIDRFGHARNVTMLVTLQRSTIETLPSLVEYAADLGVRRMRLFSVTASGDSVLSIETEGEALKKAIAEAATIAKEREVELVAGTQLGSLPYNTNDVQTCIHPWAYCYVSYSGDISFCDHLIGPGNAEYTIGNLPSSDFDSIWNSENMMRIRSEHLGERRANAEQFAHCAWCYKNKYVDFENLFDENLASHIVKLA